MSKRPDEAEIRRAIGTLQDARAAINRSVGFDDVPHDVQQVLSGIIGAETALMWVLGQRDGLFEQSTLKHAAQIALRDPGMS